MRALLLLIFGAASAPTPPKHPKAWLAVTSTVFAPNGEIPADYTCDGAMEPPPITWSTLPVGTRSVAVLVEDPDVPHGTLAHWILTGISPETRTLAPGTWLPDGAVAGTNDAGARAWLGPCPPYGEHRYLFHVFGLDTVVASPLDKGELRLAIANHVVAEGVLVGTYRRQP